MDILTSLGVDETIIYHFAIFLVTYFLLSRIVFHPYYEAYHQRTLKTEGNYDEAEQLAKETEQLKERYQQRAKQTNAEFRAVYDKAKLEALREHDRIIASAREQSKSTLERSREKIEKQAEQVRSELAQSKPEIAATIVDKMLGKELNG